MDSFVFNELGKSVGKDYDIPLVVSFFAKPTNSVIELRQIPSFSMS